LHNLWLLGIVAVERVVDVMAIALDNLRAYLEEAGFDVQLSGCGTFCTQIADLAAEIYLEERLASQVEGIINNAPSYCH